ncbi:MAG: SAM-dependent methyltransferase [Bacteroidota bacterium]|nr:SAM-dependent methyltransferase [Bacteroidota bacterium]
MPGKLYLIPVLLHPEAELVTLPPQVIDTIHRIKHYIVETPKTARAFIKKCNPQTNFSEIIIYELNEHTPASEFADFLAAINKGNDVGLMSDAGLPCTADPGAKAVAIAHQKNITVVPLTGPSSIYLSLMASGLNGQNFMFHGYLPIERNARSQKLKELEKLAQQYKSTQIFIETPYRNNSMLQDLLSTLKPQTRLCVAYNLQSPEETIITNTVENWKNKLPDLHKKPAIFLFQS